MSEVLSSNPLPEALFQAENLPTIPGVAVEVLRLCRDTETTLDDLAEALSHDAALAARLLRFANSSLYNLGQEVSSLQRATLVLGLKTVQLMSLSFSLASSLPRENAGNHFDYEGFWRRSMIRAVAGRTLARRVGSLAADEAFLCGLLAEIGQIVLAQCMTDEYEAVLQRAGQSWPTSEVELELLGFDHTTVGETLLRSWEFPELICSALGAMHRVDELNGQASEDLRTIARVLEIAALTTELLMEESGGTALASIEERARRDFDLPKETVHDFLLSLEEGVRETCDMLNVQLPPGKTHEQIVSEAKQEFLTKSLGTARELESAKRTAELEHRLRILDDPRLNDPQTGIPNEEAFHSFLNHEIRARLDGFLTRPLGILLVSVDQLAGVEGAFGAETRGEFLRMVGATLARVTRKSDLAARLEEDTFGIIMGEASAFGLKTLAERLRTEIEDQSIPADGNDLSMTVSVGGACLGDVSAASDGRALHEVARRYLTKARSAGPNRVLVHGKLLYPGKT